MSANPPRRGVVERVFQVDHPSARGHFEGNPIIPGAVLLSEAILAIRRSIGAPGAPIAVSSAKFRHPARPGDRVVIDFSWTGGEVSFSCAVEGRVVLSGQMSCPSPSTDA